MDRRQLLEAADLLAAGDWQGAHVIVQDDEDDAMACWAHAIVHLMEGDTGNAGYWYRRARRPAPVAPEATEELRAFRAALTASAQD
jgi:hypothetical protein